MLSCTYKQKDYVFHTWINILSLQNKSKISKFWKRINQELNAPRVFIYSLLLQVDHKNLFYTPSFYYVAPLLPLKLHSRVTWLFSKLIQVECGMIGSDVPCFEKVSKWLCIKYGTSWKVKTMCYRYECLSSKGPRRTYARALSGEAVLVMH